MNIENVFFIFLIQYSMFCERYYDVGSVFNSLFEFALNILLLCNYLFNIIMISLSSAKQKTQKIIMEMEMEIREVLHYAVLHPISVSPRRIVFSAVVAEIVV